MQRLLLLACLALAALPRPARADADVSAPTAACPQGVVTLHMLKPQNNPPYPSQLALFKAANPCVALDIAEVPFGQLADKISVLAASGDPPDVVVYDGPNTQSYAAAGILLPLDPYLPAGLKDDIIAPTLTEHSYQGKLYSPGLQQTALALFYNADMLAKAGITPPPSDLAHAWSWTEALAAFKKCQQGEGDNVTVWGLAPSRFGNGTPGFVYRDMLFLRTQGDPKAPPDSSLFKAYWGISPDGKTAEGWLNAPESIAGAKLFQDLFTVDRVTPKAGIPDAFQTGRACFTLDTSYFIASLNAKDPGFKWGVAPMPYSRTPIVHTGSITLGVMAKSHHPEAAAKFVIAMSTGAIALDLARSTHIMPVLKSLYPELPELKAYPVSIFVDELTQWGHPRPPSPHFAQYDKIVSDALRDIAYGAEPKARLDAAARSLQPILAR
jgi:ABC-type glycerol-3-phosphate transport system substrate-binding protein